MSSTCPTIRVVSPSSPGGFKIINESDLTKDHEIWTDGDAAHQPIMSLQEVVEDELTDDIAEPQAMPAREQGKRGRQSGKLV